MTDAIPNSRLSSIVERLERLGQEKANISNAEKEVYAEAKHDGYDPKIIRECLKLRAIDPRLAAEKEALVDTYMAQIASLPLPF